jgi:hypothetical protein
MNYNVYLSEFVLSLPEKLLYVRLGADVCFDGQRAAALAFNLETI